MSRIVHVPLRHGLLLACIGKKYKKTPQSYQTLIINMYVGVMHALSYPSLSNMFTLNKEALYRVVADCGRARCVFPK